MYGSVPSSHSAAVGSFGVFSVNSDDDDTTDRQDEQLRRQATDSLIDTMRNSRFCNWSYACLFTYTIISVLALSTGLYFVFTDHKRANQPGGVLSDGNLHPVSAANATANAADIMPAIATITYR